MPQSPVSFSLGRRALARARQEFRRYSLHAPGGRATHLGALRHLAALGVRPGTVIDVGAAVGTDWLYAAFPAAAQVLMEPLEEFHSALARRTASRPDAHLVFAAAGPRDGYISLNVHPDLVGSSLLLESEESDVNGVPRQVPMVRLDTVVTDLAVPPPYVLKVDTQGSELEVLAGARQVVLPQSDAIVLEVSLYQFFQGGPQFRQVVDAMAGHGFAVYDVIAAEYRPLDGALAQVDLVFVREDGPLRAEHHFATADQRRAQTESMRRVMTK